MMRVSRVVAVTAALLVWTNSVLAEWTPPGPIKMMIAFRVGGGADSQARMIAAQLKKRYGWEVIPQQLTGNAGLKLAKTLADMPNDGTVIGMALTETFAYKMATTPKAELAPSDFSAITTTAGFQMGIVASTASGWKSFAGLISVARRGKTIRFAVTSPRLANLAYLLGEANGVDFEIVPVKGARAVLDGLNSGRVDLGFIAGIQRKKVRKGELINLASALSTPLRQTPSAPLIGELGVPFNADNQFVFVAPKGLPTEARDALADAIASVVTDTSTDVGKLVTRALEGAVIIQGDELDALLQASYDASIALVKASKR